jgi:outer membrane protein assembly factor BamB
MPAVDGVVSASDAALARYKARLRRSRFVYAAVITAITAVVAVGVMLAFSRGEISHVYLKTAAHPPAPVRPQATTEAPESQWTSTDATALGVPFDGGTVITHDANAVRGRDAETGAVTWSYTRTDRTVCAAVQTQGVTVALYRDAGNCDELTALDSQTGRRRWTRTLDEDGVPFDGTARYQVMGEEILFISDTAIYALSASGNQYTGTYNGGVDYWTFNHYGCTIDDVAFGAAGALIHQTCRTEPCAGLTMCRNGPQLLLRPAVNPGGVSATKKAANPDYIQWNIPARSLTPVTAGLPLSAVDQRSQRLSLLDPDNGKITASLAVQPGSAHPEATAVAADGELIQLGDTTYALRDGARSFTWHTRTNSSPTISPPATDLQPDSSTTLYAARIFIADGRTAERLNPSNGRTVQRYPLLPSATDTSRVYPLGNGLLAAGSTTTYYD